MYSNEAEKGWQMHCTDSLATVLLLLALNKLLIVTIFIHV